MQQFAVATRVRANVDDQIKVMMRQQIGQRPLMVAMTTTGEAKLMTKTLKWT
jgi:hypothetical protein